MIVLETAGWRFEVEPILGWARIRLPNGQTLHVDSGDPDAPRTSHQQLVKDLSRGLVLVESPGQPSGSQLYFSENRGYYRLAAEGGEWLSIRAYREITDLPGCFALVSRPDQPLRWRRVEPADLLQPSGESFAVGAEHPLVKQYYHSQETGSRTFPSSSSSSPSQPEPAPLAEPGEIPF
jgi:hypothetical protein